MNLSAAQKEAVEFNGSPTLVVSGAGSGKTTVLTNKIVNLVHNGCNPARILAITFTNKAAEEMKTRLVEMTGLPITRFPWVRTYHSACFRILRKHCTLLGYKNPLQIYDTYQQKKIIKEILLEMNSDKKYVPAVSSHISRAKNTGDPVKYFDRNPRVSLIRLIDVYQMYETYLFSSNAVDFDNILVKTRDLLTEHRDIREDYQSRFQYVLCDEFQDTNPLQAVLTDLFVRNGNLFCVGDDWQSIYRFRGSSLDNFLSFPEKYRDARIFRLEQNYRSADEIVQIANELIGHNTYKMDKKCFSEKHGGVVELHNFSSERQEAEWVGRKLRVLGSMGIPYEKMAVLYRTKFCSLSFEEAFRRLGIPYQMMGSKGFFERKEILDINSYIKSAVFPKDNVSFERVVNTPKRGIGDKTVRKIGDARTENMSLQDAARKVLAERLMSKKLHSSLSHLIQILDDIKNRSPKDAVNEILARSGYLSYLEKYSKSSGTDYISRKENIDELIWLASRKASLIEYLEEVDLVSEDRNEEDEEGGNDKVKLSTIHASKGLEYFVVFIVGCEEDLFPHWRSKKSDAELQEERRLMYVAVTRAEQYLFVSYARFRRGESARKSRFWGEVQVALER
ncbi:UvrD-helicase domain-containing protein [Desulfobacterales bacterium HSG2]|nr:UvrD-helicase domain-containing protein [Desulfobacterales bacterium HSG2]